MIYYVNCLATSPLAPARFIGMQDGFGVFPPIALFLLEEPVGIHPVGSTVSGITLERHGFALPELGDPEPLR